MKTSWKYFLGLSSLLPASLWAAAHVTGVVTTGSPVAGTPVSGAKVVLISATPVVRLDSATTDSLGRYSFAAVTSGAFYTLEASKSNYATNSGNLNLTPTDTAKAVNVNIAGLGADVSGTITTTTAAGGSAAAPSAKVVLWNGMTATDSAVSDTTGHYALINIHVPSGAYYTIRVSKTNFATKDSSLALAPAQLTSTFNVNIIGLGTIIGRVATVGGVSIPGAKIVRVTGGVRADSTTTDTAGNYSFNAVPVGTSQIEASLTNYGTVTLPTSVASAGATTIFNLVLQGAGTIVGTVQTNALSPIANVRIRLRTGSATGTVVDSTLTNAQGVYTLSNVQARTGYFLTATYGVNITVNSATQTVTAGATTTVNFLVNTATSGTITGIVSGPSGPIVGATVIIRRGAATTPVLLTVTTDGTGRYTFVGVTTGTSSTNNNYTVTASATGYSTVTSTPNIAVTTATTVTRNISLVPVSVRTAMSTPRQGLRFSRLGDQLAVDMNVSTKVQTVEVFGLNGAAQYRVAVPAGETRAMLPANLSPANGYMVHVK